ncbi:MAG: chromosomal replication initiator protein DnaA [Myxococcota bacterium]|nr:chromosomal replication initiator protein DnaA [Myxococcota bacterium]
MPPSPPFWDGVLRRLRQDIPASTLDAWVRCLGVERAEDHLRLLCPTPFHRDRVRDRFLNRIAGAVEAETGRRFTIELGIAPRTAALPEPAATTAPAPAHARPEPTRDRKSTRASLPFTFDSFVVGPCNALAREASLALARGEQPALNPLYLSSRPGLGKTHLARAVVVEAQRAGSRRVIYESAEQFTNQFMAAIRGKNMPNFKRRYREQCELLVLEDVQFLGSKSATQLELFHTLLHLADAGARVVLTGDRLPRAIDGLDGRLRSQITAGLVAEIESPDAAVRRRILRAKAAAGGVRLPDDCLDLLVESVRGSVRDLEGALIQLVATASLLKRRLDVPLTRAALHKLSPAPEPLPPLEPKAVIETVAAFFGTTHAAMASRSRRRDVLVPRQLAMYLCRRYTDEPLCVIARHFDRDHPAVSNAVKVVERRILERAPLRYQIEELSARLDQLRDTR